MLPKFLPSIFTVIVRPIKSPGGVIFVISGLAVKSVRSESSPNPHSRGLVGSTFTRILEGEFPNPFDDSVFVEVELNGQTTSKVEAIVNESKIGEYSITVDFTVAPDAQTGSGYKVFVIIGEERSNQVDFFIQEPKYLKRESLESTVKIDPTRGNVVNIFGEIIATNKCGAYRNLKYTLMDQDTTAYPILEENVLIMEIVKERLPNGIQLLLQNVPTDDNGMIGDTIAILGESSCPPVGLQLNLTQTFTARYRELNFTLTTKNSILVKKEAPSTYTIEITPVTP